MMSRAAIIQAEPQSVCPLTDSCTHLCWEISQQLRRAPDDVSRLDSRKSFDAAGSAAVAPNYRRGGTRSRS